MKDQISYQRVQLLHPHLRAEAERIIDSIESKWPESMAVRVTSTYRSFKEQDALYAKGRTTKGYKVTNAKSGQSLHNYGLALDFVILLNGKTISWDTVIDRDFNGIADWWDVINAFKEAGWESGADFKSFKDLPHLQKTGGIDWRTAKARYDSGDTFVDSGVEYINL